MQSKDIFIASTRSPSPRRRVRFLISLALTVGVGIGISGPGVAVGATRQPYLSEGLVDDPTFQSSVPALRSAWFARAQQIGSTAVRLNAVWASIAPLVRGATFHPSDPGDPQYHWIALDAAIRTATAYHQQVVLMTERAPRWAEGPNRPDYVEPGAWAPNPKAYAKFARALALRYSGRFRDPLNPFRYLPRVRVFQAWNEPNLPTYLMPQWTLGQHGAPTAASPGIYRSLLNAFYRAVKEVQPDSFVIGAGTAPYGDPPGVSRMKPLTFLRGVFCLSPRLHSRPCSSQAHFDALDHHPYAVNPTRHAKVPGDVSVPDVGLIRRVLLAAESAGRALPRGPKSLWITEVGFSSWPPTRFRLARQARFAAETLYELWRQGVGHVFWFQLRDPVVPNGPFTGGGLYFDNGLAKPSAAAFRFPFVALKASHDALSVWGKAPQAGTIIVERRVRRRWSPIRRVNASRGGIFFLKLRYRPGSAIRAQVGRQTSLTWSPR